MKENGRSIENKVFVWEAPRENAYFMGSSMRVPMGSPMKSPLFHRGDPWQARAAMVSPLCYGNHPMGNGIRSIPLAKLSVVHALNKLRCYRDAWYGRGAPICAWGFSLGELHISPTGLEQPNSAAVPDVRCHGRGIQPNIMRNKNEVPTNFG